MAKLGTLLTAKERTIRNGKAETGRNDNDALPGVSYLPHKLEIAEDRHVQERVATEFIDFLDCVTDLLQVVSMIRPKHLRSMVPLPFDIIRDIRTYKSKSTALKRFDKQLAGRAKGISSSVEDLLTSRSVAMMSKGNKKPRKRNLKETNRNQVQSDLLEIIGKKTTPMWHVVLLEKHKGSVSVGGTPNNITNEVKQRSRKGTNTIGRMLKEEKGASSGGVFKTHSEELLSSIRYVRALDVEPTSKVYETQMDMIEAYFDGFTSVEEHKRYLDTLTPHWFTDLLKVSLNTGVVFCKPVIDGYHRLGQFYTFNENHDKMCRAKLCFVVQSLPVWDATRMTLQRAVEFILREILLSANPAKDVSDWLAARRLPYVVLPPISSTYNNEFGDGKQGAGEEDPKEKQDPQLFLSL